MERFTNKQRVQIVKTYHQNRESGAETVRRLRAVFGRNEAPNKSTVLRLIKKFESTGSVATVKSPGRNRTQRIAQQIAMLNSISHESLNYINIKNLKCILHNFEKREMVNTQNTLLADCCAA
ncbi:hypothetical protein ACI65C_013484 [Semiaphis heraclei]